MDLIAEADEALRRERLENLWKEYGKYLLAGIALAIVLTGGLSAYRSWDAGVRENNTAALLAMMEDPAFPGNVQEKSEDLRPAGKAIAVVMAARRHIQNGETEKTLALLGDIANDQGAPATFRDMAVVMKISLQPQTAETADGALAALGGVMQDEKSPWRHHARLLAASIAGEIKQDYAGALGYLQAVMETPELPPSIYGRAARLQRLYEAQMPAVKTDGNVQVAPEQGKRES